MAARARRSREVGRCLQSSQIKLLQASLPRWVALRVENLKLADSDPSFIRYFFGVSIPPSTPSLSMSTSQAQEAEKLKSSESAAFLAISSPAGDLQEEEQTVRKPQDLKNRCGVCVSSAQGVTIHF